MNIKNKNGYARPISDMMLSFSCVKTQLQWSQRCSDQLQRKIQSTMEELSVIQEKLGKLSFILLNTNKIHR